MTRRLPPRKIIALALVGVAWIGIPSSAHADDRDLLFAKRQAAPNVLIILDSSGSMNDDFTDSFNYAAWMDDPRSKLQTAKQVLSKVLPQLEVSTAINFGFTTYKSGTSATRGILDTGGTSRGTNGAASRKQWLYTAGTRTNLSANPWSGSTTDTKGIELGSPLQFGGITPFGDATCTDISGVNYANGAPTCPAGQTGFRQFYGNFGYTGTGTAYYAGNKTGLGNPPAVQLLSWCPTNTVSGHGATLYADKCRLKMTLTKFSSGGLGDYGDPQITVHEVIQFSTCTGVSGSNCNAWSGTVSNGATNDMIYNRATDPNDSTWDGSFFAGYDIINGDYNLSDVSSPTPCSNYQTELLPTTGLSESATKPLIPIKTDSNNDDLQETYLDLDSSPNKTRGGVDAFLRRTSSVVKFNKATYGYTIGGDLSALSPALEEITNIAWANNNTPVAGALADAYTYFNTDAQFTAAKDALHACRKNYVLLITDGLETCQSTSTPCTAATNLGKLGVPVFVIGIGLDSVSGNSLKCIATNSVPAGTDNPVYTPQNASELADAINKIFNSLSSASRDFSTVAVPSVSTTSEGVAYVSSFNPRNNRSIWAGHLREFVLNTGTGQITTDSSGLPLTTAYSFGTVSPPAGPSGYVVWDAGDTDTTIANIYGDLSAATSNQRVDPTLVLAPTTTWSTNAHDQATGVVGRNVFFSLRPGDTGCTSTTYLCLAQLPVGNTGSAPPAPPTTLPNWWANVRDSSSYASVPGTTPEGSTTANRDQALQNSFSFIRGNRDPVVEKLKISGLFDATHTTCSSLAGHVDSQGDVDSPCYYGEVLGDVFHGNPIVVSFPSNVRYFQAQDPKALNFGLYSDRSASYQSFYSSYRHRRKIVYAGGNDGFLHAIDAGVYNGDQGSYTDPVSGATVSPLLNRYDLGSGREIFGYAPRVAVQKFYQLAHTVDQDWTMDGPPISDDVYIDVTRVNSTPQGIRSSDGCATPPCTNIAGTSPAWRTIVVGGEREGGIPPTSSGGNLALGGGSVYALDVTDPDLPAHMDAAHNGVTGSPECLVNGSASVFVPGTSAAPAGCNAPFPRILWEFVDNTVPTANAQTGPTGSPGPTNENEKASGNPESTTQDLGYTWSRPAIARIKVKDTAANQNRDFFVAIFGGGYRNISANQNLSDTNVAGDTGNFLYMVDVETGKLIYKRDLGIWTSGASGTNTTGNLEAGLPGDPAVIDLNQDGYVDYIYIGDTQGRVWKIDLTAVAPFTGGKIAALDSGNNPVWSPTLLFDEYQTAAATGGEARQPIFTQPAVYLLGTKSNGQPRLGVAFGTGDRDNMPASTDSHPNWFFVVVDDPGFTYPVFKSNLTLASLTANNCTAANTCVSGTGKGLYIPLQTLSGQGAEIVNSNPLVFNNTIFFTTFYKAASGSDSTTCKVGGSAFAYSISPTTFVSQLTDANGNPVAPSVQGGGAQVASAPIVYQGPNGELIVISALDNTAIVNLNKPAPPIAKVKSWKEQ